ncbi:hypothetical protein Tco_0238128 [Tanacetum coccineum]
MAQQQQIIPTDQLISIGYQSIRRCNSYTVFQNIPTVYLQQFWNTIRKVPNANETIRFMLDRQEITYTVDMFRSTFNIKYLLHEESCSTVVSVYTIGNVTVRGMLILNESITDDIRATEKYKEYEKVFVQVYISRLNPFGCAKLTTFVVMCKAYGCEPTVELFQGFFNLCRGGKWLTFAKRPEKHIPHLFPKFITLIEGWKGRFFYVQNSIVPAKYPQLLLEKNKFDSKSYKDKLPSPHIEQNPMFQRLGCYPISVRVFPDPILFLAGLQSSWEHGQQ